MLEMILDGVTDTLKLVPFLFLTYLLMEYIEHRMTQKSLLMIQKAGNFGPLIGGAVGIVPQCGFSAAASSLYAGKIISLGTLIAIYLSTSDEMLPLFISEQLDWKLIMEILVSKALIGIFWGFITDFVLFRNEGANEHIQVHSMCEQEHCNCDKGILGSSIKHTLKITAFILVISIILNICLGYVGTDALSGSIINAPVVGPLIMSLIGLIPNCAASVAITELYIEGVIGVGPLMAGLLSGAGVGWLVLARAGHSVKRLLKVIGLLYVFGAVSGILIQLFF